MTLTIIVAILLERYIFFLENEGAQGDVMAESRGGKEDMRLKKSFSRLYNEETQFFGVRWLFVLKYG